MTSHQTTRATAPAIGCPVQCPPPGRGRAPLVAVYCRAAECGRPEDDEGRDYPSAHRCICIRRPPQGRMTPSTFASRNNTATARPPDPGQTSSDRIWGQPAARHVTRETLENERLRTLVIGPFLPFVKWDELRHDPEPVPTCDLDQASWPFRNRSGRRPSRTPAIGPEGSARANSGSKTKTTACRISSRPAESM